METIGQTHHFIKRWGSGT